MATPNTRRLVSLATAADMLDVSTKTIRRNIAEGELDAVRLGRKTLKVKAESIERLIDARPVGNWRLKPLVWTDGNGRSARSVWLS